MAKAAKSTGRLEIRVLGELELEDQQGARKLPQSRKTRALLAYLALSRREHRRDRLCSLFWDVTEDPRGALRWSLSKLRQVADGETVRRIDANRSTVRFAPEDTRIDLDVVAATVSKIETASIEELEAAAAMFRGELLESSDLFDFDEFQGWLIAKREEAIQHRIRLCRALISRHADAPERALPHVRSLVAVAPVDEEARCTLVRVLWACGRHREAEAQVENSQRALIELGSGRSTALAGVLNELRSARQANTRTGENGPTVPAPAGVPRSPLARTTIHGLRMVGRQAEISSLAAKLDEVKAQNRSQVVIVKGEPGVGKSRMLVSLIVETRSRRGSIIEGCAYEAESGRAYGPWIDALGRIPKQLLSEETAAELAPLLGKEQRAPETKNRLFQAVVNLLVEQSSRSAPLLVALDDLQWFDEASLELLHYVVRFSSSLPILIALTVRDGELADNLAAVRTVRGIRRAGPIEEQVLGPLDRDQTEQLVRLLQVKFDIDEVFRESGGNPLFALEVARSFSRSDSGATSSLTDIVRDRIDGLASLSADVLRWAAVLGPVFSVKTLRELVTADDAELGDTLDELERHALIGGVVDPEDPGSTYQFSHHLVRRVVYGELSTPRRRMMHQKVVATLRSAMNDDDSRAVELLHHAAEAGEPLAAAEACVVAANRCIRLFAPGQAESLLRRGLRQLGEREGQAADELRARLSALLETVGQGASEPVSDDA